MLNEITRQEDLKNPEYGIIRGSNAAHCGLFSFFITILDRGTDYINLKPYKHPVQPSFEQIKNKINEIAVC
jgi:hypothetical protein